MDRKAEWPDKIISTILDSVSITKCQIENISKFNYTSKFDFKTPKKGDWYMRNKCY